MGTKQTMELLSIKLQKPSLNIPPPVRMTPCPPRLQLQTLWIGVILTGEMTFKGVLNPCPPQTLTQYKTSHPNSIEDIDI